MRCQPERLSQERVALPGILEEFRRALSDEIDAARRTESAQTVALTDGRRIGHVAGHYQYVFGLESTLQLPGGAPADLKLPGRQPVQVDVISVEGLTITVSSPEDLGLSVPDAHLESDLTFLLQRLIARIEEGASRPNPAGDMLLGGAPILGRPASIDFTESDLFPEQKEAVESSLGRNMTFIWGPPGTGKTRTIGAIGHELFKRDRSLLVVSHTNTAVDQAVLHIAEAVGLEALADGKVLRAGDPHDRRVNERPDLLLQTHVERRSSELAMRKQALEDERSTTSAQVERLSRQIDICEWVAEARSDIASMQGDFDDLCALERQLEENRRRESELVAVEDNWTRAAEASRQAEEDLRKIATLRGKLEGLKQNLLGTRAVLQQHRERLAEADQLQSEAELLEPFRVRAGELPSAEAEEKAASLREDQARKSYEHATSSLSEAEALLAQTLSVGWLLRKWRGLPRPDHQAAQVATSRTAVDTASEELRAAASLAQAARSQLADIKACAHKVQDHRNVPALKEQMQRVASLLKDVQALEDRLRETLLAVHAIEPDWTKVQGRLETFKRNYGKDPASVRKGAESAAQELASLRVRLREIWQECSARRAALEEMLRHRISTLREWKLSEESPADTQAMLAVITAAYDRAAADVAQLDVAALRTEFLRLSQRISTIGAEIQALEEALRRVRDQLIADARVVATTITRAYLWDCIQQRNFDTVVVDEASMAPIPALWVISRLSKANLAVVGDFMQLPPIVRSTTELSQKWLGQDIFKHAGVDVADHLPAHVVRLRTQNRMHPEICRIPNSLFYDGLLNDGPRVELDGDLFDWYRGDWGHDCPVLLVDTGPLDAWVTSVPRRGSASRLNFLSATVCVDLAQQVLREDRPKWSLGETPRILIVSPYRAHALLLRRLLDEEPLTGEVMAGTVHSFQGSEADVVMLDLVNDEPHWRVGMFIPSNDEGMQRLLNVALTRARRRLIVVGDFAYILRKAPKAFVGARLIPFLQKHYPCVSALDVVPNPPYA